MTQEEQKATQILLVDDHPIVREGLAQLINAQAHLNVCGEAEDEETALKSIKTLSPDLLIVDVSLGDCNGIELVKQIKAYYENLPMLVLSMHDETVYAPRALQAGARGYIMKREARQNIVTAINRILEGGIYVSDRMASQYLQQIATGKPVAPDTPIGNLTDRELQIFELIGSGKSTRQIAELLHRSIKTIEAHREHIKEKLNLKNASELNQQAYQWVHSG